MTKDEFKELFIELTEYTIPFGKESELEGILPSGFKKDSIGNYYYEIGESDTLFTTHLDTYSDKYEKVNHVIHKDDPYVVGTDGSTILGGDNKLGTTILIGMIKKNIPGTYFFFLGEEPLKSGGLYGSSNALAKNPEYFSKFKRCIAFDRREYGSIVVRQMGRMCCSKDFATAIAGDLKKIGDIHWDEEGAFGYYTDTAVFMDVIEECTNLSAGGFKEHYKSEYADLNYTYKVYETALKIDFENLPVSRKLEGRFTKQGDSKISKYAKFKQGKNKKDLGNLFKILNLTLTRNVTDGDRQRLTFSRWLEDYDIDIYLEGEKIIFEENEFTVPEFKKEVLEIFYDDIVGEVEYYLELIEEDGDKEAVKTLMAMMSAFDCNTFKEFEDFLNN